MSSIKTGNVIHDKACQVAESIRQAAAVPGASQAAVTAAEIAFYKTVRDSELNNGLPEVAMYNNVIRQLGGTP
jgi:hypothetical protein